MTFQPPPHTDETRVYAAPVVLADGSAWCAGLGDVQVYGKSPTEARQKLWLRLEELRRELLTAGGQGRRVA